MSKNEGYSYRLQIEPAAQGQTVLEFLANRFRHSAPHQWQERIEAGEVHVDGVRACPDQVLRQGMQLVWNRPGWIEEATPQDFKIAFEDQHLVVVNKPRGLPTIPGGGFLNNTLLHLLQTHFATARPMHRLGRGTSGLVLFAKTQFAASLIGKQWPKVQKHYLALAVGHAERTEYTIETRIGPVEHPRLGSVHAASGAGKNALSCARVLRLLTRQAEEPRTLFEVLLCTGRPHQIRIHLASIGHPLVGDPMYSAGGGLKKNAGLPGEGNYFLHAERLEFVHPVGGHSVKVQCDVPLAFEQQIMTT